MSDRKPIVTAVERSPFGDITPEEAEKLAGNGRDRFFIPGYSDKRIKRELDIRDGKQSATLSHRFHLVPVQTIDGRPIAKGVADKRQEGYRPVKLADCKGLGIDIDGTAFIPNADGVLCNGDSMLMVTDAKHAAANYIAQERRNEALQDSPRALMEESTAKFNRTMGLTDKNGAQPIFEIEERA